MGVYKTVNDLILVFFIAHVSVLETLCVRVCVCSFADVCIFLQPTFRFFLKGEKVDELAKPSINSLLKTLANVYK